MSKLIDLHTHTSYSDGQYTPDELIKLAIDRGIDTLAITDHDTVNGILTVNKDDYKGIKIINGIELSAKVDKGQMHILGYGIDPENELLTTALLDIKDKNIEATLRIIEQVKKDHGLIFGDDEIAELVNADHNIGRPDVALLCVKHGYVTSVSDAFKKYLIDAYNKTRKDGKGIPYEECIGLIRASGGIPVLAHPTTLNLSKEELEQLLREMIMEGLKGIEVYHSNQSKKESEFYLSLAQKYHLLVSGGSDFHGPNIKPDIELGTGKNNNLKIKSLSILPRLK